MLSLEKLTINELEDYRNQLITNIKQRRDNCNLLGIDCEPVEDVNSKLLYTLNNSDELVCLGFRPRLRKLPSVTVYLADEIAQSAFVGVVSSTVQSLTSFYAPFCKVVNSMAFCQCTWLKEVKLPKCIKVLHYAFDNCTSLTNCFLPICEELGNSCFYNCPGLESIELPSCKYLSAPSFKLCKNLQQVSLPVCESLASSTFISCAASLKLSAPKCKDIPADAIQ